ncbi:MAG: helix-turn-helix transcriptional regulator [Hyphomicrobium aestuarii]|nr:helix-turn-helix transcriptional regulator [Hyphomicrobium aestuarii]
MDLTVRRTFAQSLKAWRTRRSLSQLALALEANVSARHIAFLETGRSRPSRDMVLQLAARLDLPLRARNELLESAGFIGEFRENGLDGTALLPVRSALNHMLKSHHPFPALICDRHWNLVDTNPAAHMLLAAMGAGQGANLGQVLTSSPAAQAVILNWTEVVQNFANRLRLELKRCGGDPVLQQLIAKAEAATGNTTDGTIEPITESPFVAVQFLMGDRVLSMLSIIAEFGTPRDITVGDLRIELFFPADAETESYFSTSVRL